MMTEMITLGDGTAIPLERFIDMIATKVAIKLKELNSQPSQICQAAAYRQYGRKRVEAWVAQGRLTQYRTGRDGHSIRHDTSQLMELAHEEQDYLYRNLSSHEDKGKETPKKKRQTKQKKGDSHEAGNT